MGLDVLDIDKLKFLEAKRPQLYIESWSNAARTVEIRGMTKHGTFSLDHTTNGDRSIATDLLGLPDFPIIINAAPSSSPVRRGELYLRLTLRVAGFDIGVLSAGYLTDGKNVTWPPGVFEGFTDGPGLIRTIIGTDPAVGEDVHETVPTNAVWRLVSIRYKLITDVNSANRTMRLLLWNTVTNFLYVRSPVTQAASEVRYYENFVGAPYETAFGPSEIAMALPKDLIMPQGYQFKIDNNGGQVGDAFSLITYAVEEWIQE